MTKLDLFMLEDERFAESGFSRRQRVALAGGASLQVLSVEDPILPKLKWFRHVEAWAAKLLRAERLERGSGAP